MNKLQKHPSLEVSKAISHLIPDSESHWIKRLDTGEEFIIKKGQEGYYKWEKLANAPDCVELGEWMLKEKELVLIPCDRSGHIIAWKPVEGIWWKRFVDPSKDAIVSESEVQAKAELVKRIIESE